MTTQEMERRNLKMKEELDALERQADELWNTAKTDAEVERYNELSQLYNDKVDEWCEAEQELFARWDHEALHPKGAK